nr:integrin alpha [Microlunatus antarcticus]
MSVAGTFGMPLQHAHAVYGGGCGADGDLGAGRGPEVVVGLPNTNADAGAIDVWATDRYATLTLASLSGTASAAGDRFGAAVTVMDVNCDRANDLVVGAPGADHGRGRVYVVLDPLSDQKPATVFVVGRGQNEGAHFGAAIAAAGPVGPDQGPLISDLWIGAPGTDLSSAYQQEGAVNHYTSTRGGQGTWLGLDLVETLRPETPGVDSVLVDGHYGAALATSPGRVLIGAPDAGWREASHAGFVKERRRVDGGATFEHPFLWSRETPGVPGNPTTGDRFGASLASSREISLIGAPGVDVGKADDAGSVLMTTDVGSWSLPDRTFTYGQEGIPGKPRSGDHLGQAVALGDNLGCAGLFQMQAAFGAPGRDVKHKGRQRDDAGAVVVVPTTNLYGECKDATILDQSHELAGTPEAGDHVGAALGVLRYTEDVPGNGLGDRVLVGAPGEDWQGKKNAGIVQAGAAVPPGIVDPRAIPVSHSYRTSLTNSHGPRKNLRYGAVLAGELGI